MAKRQIRISNTTISLKWPEISGKKVNIVLTDGTVLMAMLNELHNGQLKIRNMRLKQQSIGIDKISEIILDY